MKRRIIPDKGFTGFTIIEVVIASVLLAIVVTGIAFFFMHIIRLSDQVDDQTKALELCREGIESAKTQNILSMSDGWQTTENLGQFNRTLWIDTPYNEYPEAKLVLCRVVWSGVEGADSISLRTIL